MNALKIYPLVLLEMMKKNKPEQGANLVVSNHVKEEHFYLVLEQESSMCKTLLWSTGSTCHSFLLPTLQEHSESEHFPSTRKHFKSSGTHELFSTLSVERAFPEKSLGHSFRVKSSQPQVLVQQIIQKGASEPQSLQLRILEPTGVSPAFPTQLFMPVSTAHYILRQL